VVCSEIFHPVLNCLISFPFYSNSRLAKTMLTSLPIFSHKPFTYVSAYTCTACFSIFLGKNSCVFFPQKILERFVFPVQFWLKFLFYWSKVCQFFDLTKLKKRSPCTCVYWGVCVCACVLKDDSFGKIPNISHYKQLWSGKYCPLLFISMLPTLTYNMCTIQGDEFHPILTNFLIFL
jgi:hypothetical protein